MKIFWKTVLMFVGFLTLSGIAYADGDRNGGLAFEARLTGDQEVIANQVPPLGTGSPPGSVGLKWTLIRLHEIGC